MKGGSAWNLSFIFQEITQMQVEYSGCLKIRNVIECVLLCFPIIILTFLSSPFGLTATIIICMVFVIPIGGFSLIGIHDYSLLTFIRLYIRWRKSRRILVYRGIKWINTRKTTKKKKRVKRNLKNTAIRKSKGRLQFPAAGFQTVRKILFQW